MRKFIITIDGPAASGKEKIAKYISNKWKLIHLDSGVLYRKLAIILIDKKINIKKTSEIDKFLKNIKIISYRKDKKVRSEEVGIIASQIAIYDNVRKFINNLQHNFVNSNSHSSGFVIDGRDIGSKVFKKAQLKLYIDVNPEIRAKRRYKQLIDRGEKSIYQKILKEIKLRDKKDSIRKNSPLIIPKDAFVIDNNESFKKTIDQIKLLINKSKYVSK